MSTLRHERRSGGRDIAGYRDVVSHVGRVLMMLARRLRCYGVAMPIASRLLLGCACGALMATAPFACDSQELSECHQRMVERLGCCPICDAECRGAVDRECVDDVHEVPVEVDDSVNAEGSSTSNGSGDIEVDGSIPE
jgi:hypothetical protein